MSYSIETFKLTKKFSVIRGYGDMLVHPFRKKEITALRSVNLQIKKGELFGLLGLNGAGKTTLIKILCTLMLPTSGKAFINGIDVTINGKKVRNKIGYVISDERSFYWRLTGRQNLKFFAKLNNIFGREADLKIDNLLEFMKLSHVADRMFKDYSTGMKQKMAIARGLLTDPEIIFMDEPTRSLDPQMTQDLRRLIRERLVDEGKRTVIFATHNLSEAEEICDCIAIIHKGVVKISGTVSEMKRMFHSGKRYIMIFKNAEYNLLERLSRLTPVKKVIPNSNGSLSNGLQVEVEMISSNGNISHLIEETIKMGSKISCVYEKESSLEELFSKITDE